MLFFFRAVHHSIVTIFIKYTKGRLCADYLVRVFIQLSTVTKLSNGPIYLWVISDCLFFFIHHEFTHYDVLCGTILYRHNTNTFDVGIIIFSTVLFKFFCHIWHAHSIEEKKISNLWIVEYKMPFNRISVIITSLIWYVYGICFVNTGSCITVMFLISMCVLPTRQYITNTIRLKLYIYSHSEKFNST